MEIYRLSYSSLGGQLKALLASAVVVLALVVGIASSVCADASLGDRITATVEKGPGTKLVMADLTDFDWQKLYVFTPYTTQKQIDRTLGFEWHDTEGIELNDTMTLLAFVDDGKVVSHVAQPADKGDFSGLSEGPWTPESAVFVVADDRDAGLGEEWLVLQQASP